MILQIGKAVNFNKKRDKAGKLKGVALAELAMYFIGILFVIGVAYMNWPTIRNFFRSGSQWLELRNMQSAATSYTSLRLDGAAPTSANDLIEGVEATDSVDGQKHDGFMSPKSGRWKNGSYTDAWGEEFTFADDEDGAHSITSNGPDKTYGTEDDIVVYY